jgi:uncharacterized protein YbaR (Trm112 family)
MIDRNLLEILACPETLQSLEPANRALVARLNARIGAGELRDRAARLIRERLDDLLVRTDAKYGYPVRDDVPILESDAAIPLVPDAEQC